MYSESQMKRIIILKCHEIEDKIDDIFGIEINPVISFKLRGKVAGYACYNNEVKFNLAMAIENDDKFINDTIAHELAHMVQFKLYPTSKPHGREWQSIMLKLGYNPTRCHNMSIPQTSKNKVKRYEYKCLSCGRIYNVSTTIHNKIINRIQIRKCHCNGKIQFTGKIIEK